MGSTRVLRENFLQRCDALCARWQIGRARLSKLLFNKGNCIDALSTGERSIRFSRFDEAVAALDQLEKLGTCPSIGWRPSLPEGAPA